jgi:hypothetical protein
LDHKSSCHNPAGSQPFHLIIILLTIKPIPVIPIAFIIALVAGVVVAEYSTASLDFYEKFVGTRGGFKAGE